MRDERSITVDKLRLIEILEKNRDGHRRIFEEALVGWRERVLERVEELYQQAREGKLENAYLSLPRPEDHTRDYDRVIGMLQLDVNDQVELTASEYAMFVEDDWGWQKSFLLANADYSERALRLTQAAGL